MLAALALCLAGVPAPALVSTNLPPELAAPSVEAAECRVRQGLPNFFSKLRAGRAVRIAYLGGSITAQEGWRPKTLKWFQSQFPRASITQINAAIGGTGSDLGVFRCRQDVLEQKPDLLFVEFAVNDAGARPEQIYRCMEGIVRQTWQADATADICFVYTIAGNMLETLQAGRFPRSASAMEKLADHYGIPTIHMGVEVARLEKAGRLVFKGDKPRTDSAKAELGNKILFSPDAVHPYTDTGHQLYLEAVVRSMELIQKAETPARRRSIAPLVEDNWEKARMLSVSRAKLSSGWQKLDPTVHPRAKSFKNRLPELWMASTAAEHLSFKFKGTAAGVYDLLGPDCGQLLVIVDEGKPKTVSRFDAYCTYHRLGKIMVAENLSDTTHSIKMEIQAEPPDKRKILAQRNETMDDPRRFEGIAWYAGYLLLIGDLVEE